MEPLILRHGSHVARRVQTCVASQPEPKAAACCYIASISILPGVVSEFRTRMPDVAVKMINRTSEEVRAFFEASVVDLGIAEMPVDLVNVERRRYAIDLVAILPVGHPATARSVLSPNDLAGHPFVSMATSRTIGHQIRSAVA
jgi:DNA-binding transcriptional LysR family regulator